MPDRDFHDHLLLFDSQTTQFIETMDQIAERIRQIAKRIRKIGATTLRLIGDIACARTCGKPAGLSPSANPTACRYAATT